MTEKPPAPYRHFSDLLRVGASRHGRWMAAAAFAMMLGVAGGVTTAQAQDDEEDIPFEQRIIRSLLGGGGGAGIDYRERSPLVIPPGTDLPPPSSGASPTGTAAWPRDPDRAQRRQARRGLASDEAARAENPLSPGELMRGRRAGAGRHEGPAPTISDEGYGIPLKPSELGDSRGLFGLIGRAVTPEKVEPFAGEPPRQRLIEPPSGYRTPSSAQPYQPPVRGRTPQKATLPDPAAGATRN